VSRLTVDLVDGLPGLHSLRSEWEALFDAVPSASPFLSYAWMAAWQATVGEGGRPLILCARDGGHLVGLLALSERRSAAIGKPVRRVSFMGERVVAADGLDVLALPGCARPVVGAIVARLAAEPIDLLVLDGLPPDSATMQQLAWQLGNDGRGAYTLSTHQICPYLDLSAGWEGTLSRSRRPHQFGRLLRAVSALDGFEIRTVTEPGLVGAALERLLALHDRRWAVQGGSDALTLPSVRDFHRRIVAALAQGGMVRFEELWAQGACRATYYGFERGDHYWLYQTGYDPGWAKKSVAFVRMGLSIKEAAQRGVRYYDLLRGTETYKFDWAAGARVTLSAQVVAHRPAARLLARARRLRVATETAAEAVFPVRSLDLLRQWRRSRQRRREAPTPTLPRERGREIPGPTTGERGREIARELAEVGDA
jgi:CelD/BcsL family acetyltransferase involved in cellulose biosynthesis